MRTDIPPATSGRQVVIVDDEPDFARGLARLICGHFDDVQTRVFDSGRAALQALGEQPAQVMITDLRMPEMNGMQLLAKALHAHPELSVVLLSAYGTVETAVQALHTGAYDFLTKPIEPEQLFRVVLKGLERSRLLEENSRLRQLVEQRDSRFELIGEGPASQRVRRTIAAIAQSDYTVLIRGESGTGKELAARHIHRSGTRADKPFVVVNCPSIPENLLESELVGHVRGAFTGADREHRGLFAAAEGGTIHLDEIGDISPPVQAKLLRFLQDGEIRPVGADRSRRIDVRVIASTNRDLEAAIGEQLFREDLYYRLNVLSVTMPPLRELTEDIPLLAAHLLRLAGLEDGQPRKELAPEVLGWLSERPWPGNVRELQNVLRRLMVFCPGPTVHLDLVRRVLPDSPGPQPDAGTRPGNKGPAVPYKAAKEKVLDDFTRAYIEDLLPATRGNISEAARVSGLSRVALQKILNRLGEQAARYR